MPHAENSISSSTEERAGMRASPEDLLERWTVAGQCAFPLSASIGERVGVPASPKPGEGGRCRKFYFDGGQVKIAAEIVYELDADSADPFDLLCHLAFNAPVLIMRKDKGREAERLKADMKDKGRIHASTVRTQTTAQSLGSLLKSARDIMRKDKGLNGDLDRPPMLSRSAGLTGRGDCLVVPFPGPPLRVSPGFNMSGFQPCNQSGPKARNVIARAEGPGNPPPQISQAL